MPPTFFICYRREDAGYAAALSRALVERHGSERVFKDITSLQLARDWRSEVTAAIGRSSHVLALVGPNWMAGVDQRGQPDAQASRPLRLTGSVRTAPPPRRPSRIPVPAGR